MIYTEANLGQDVVQNVFGEWVPLNTEGPSVCVRIPITEEVRKRDAALQAEREAKHREAITWSRPAALPEVHHVKRVYLLPAGRSHGKRPSRKTKEHGAGRPKCACGMWVDWNSAGELCWRCRRAAARRLRDCAGGCGKSITVRNLGDLCWRCRRDRGIRLDRVKSNG